MQKQKQLLRASAKSERQQHTHGQMPRSPQSCQLLPKLWHARDCLTRLALQGQQGQAEDHHAEEHSLAAAVAAIDPGVVSAGEMLSSANPTVAAETATLVACMQVASDAASFWMAAELMLLRIASEATECPNT